MEREIRMIDIDGVAQQAEVVIAKESDGTASIWVNVDGVCRLRIKSVRRRQLAVDYRPAEWTGE